MPKFRAALIAAALFSITVSVGHARDAAPSEGLRFGRIVIDRRNVFQTGSKTDDAFLYSWANRLHIVTRESAVRRELLFREGDPYDPSLVSESERILRDRGLFRYVKIATTTAAGGLVDVHIETDDVWTTAVILSYEAAGGENLYRAGFLEQNLLGYGIKAGAFIDQDIDRLRQGFSYEDPRIAGSPLAFFGGYGEDEKGRAYELRLGRPFRSPLTRFSAGTEISVEDDEDRLFSLGDEIADFDHKTRDVRTFASIASSPRLDGVTRWSLAHAYQEDVFFDFESDDPALASPDDRVVSAVLLGLEWRERRFIKRRAVATFDRDEDINLGWDVFVEAGPSLSSLGATRDGAAANAAVRRAWAFADDQFLFFRTEASSRYEQGAVRNGVTRARGRWISRNWWRENTAVLTGELRVGRNLDRERQFLLGGENGLRGYDVRRFSGNKAALITVESRRLLVYDWLQLGHIGWAVFADAGRTWEQGDSLSLTQFKSDIGAGLRIAPSRSVSPDIIRVDIAYALDDNGRGSRWVASVGGEIVFGEQRERKFDF